MNTSFLMVLDENIWFQLFVISVLNIGFWGIYWIIKKRWDKGKNVTSRKVLRRFVNRHNNLFAACLISLVLILSFLLFFCRSIVSSRLLYLILLIGLFDISCMVVFLFIIPRFRKDVGEMNKFIIIRDGKEKK